MQRQNKITTLFLDIGGVLLSNGWGHDFRRQAVDKFHLDLVEFELRHKFLFVLYEEGKVSLDEYLDNVIFYQNRDFTRQEFKEYMFSLTTPDTGMISMVKQMKEKFSLKVIVVSNEAREMNEHRIRKFQLNTFVDFFVSSCYVGMRKPDKNIYQLALDGAQVPAYEIVYIDDVQFFVEVAHDLGIKGIVHKDYLSTCKALEALGLQVT